MDQETRRKIWCTSCDMPTNHIIEYRGTRMEGDLVLAIFFSRCCRCKARRRGCKEEQVVAVNDYNALMQKEIYA